MNSILSNELLTSALNHAEGLIFIANSKHDIIYANNFMRTFFNIHNEEMINKNVFNLLIELNINLNFSDSDLNEIKVGEPLKKKYKDNKKSLCFTIKKSMINNVNYFLFHGENRAKFEELKTKHENDRSYLNNVIENMPEYVYWKDLNLRYVRCNKAVSNFLGLDSPKDIEGKTDYDFGWNKDRIAILHEIDKDIITKGVSNISEDSIPNPDGTTSVMITSKNPLRNNDGDIIGVLGISTDITEMKKLEAQIINEKKRVERSNQVKFEFIRDMEHDLRTPFNGLYGMSLYLWEIETDSLKKELLGDIAQSAKELLYYCNGILDYSKIDKGNLAYKDEEFCLKEAVHRVYLTEKPAAALKEIQFSERYDDNLPSAVIGDEYRIFRLLINLVSNAIKFTESGNVALEVNLIKLQPSSADIQFIIKDTGIGLPPDKVRFIYEDSSSLGEKTLRKYKGLGLGLKIVKQFVSEMNGQLDVTTEKGHGTTFICTIPYPLPHTKDHTENSDKDRTDA